MILYKKVPTCSPFRLPYRYYKSGYSFKALLSSLVIIYVVNSILSFIISNSIVMDTMANRVMWSDVNRDVKKIFTKNI